MADMTSTTSVFIRLGVADRRPRRCGSCCGLHLSSCFLGSTSPDAGRIKRLPPGWPGLCGSKDACRKGIRPRHPITAVNQLSFTG